MKKTTLTYLFLTGLLVVTSGIALTNGASHFSLLALSPTAQNTLFNIRLPRILAALLAGATVAVSGALFQAALRNPIADPGIMGVASGAHLFALLGGLVIPGLFFNRVLWALAGGWLAFELLVRFQPKMDPYRLILVGVAINAMFSGFTALIPTMPGQSSLSLATVTWTQTTLLAVLGLGGLIITVLLAPWGNYLKVSDAQLVSLGQSPQHLRRGLLLTAVFLAATTTACVGVLAFIGIIVPHLGRQLVGRDYNRLLPFTMLAGGWLLLFFDTLGRLVIQPSELPATALLAIFGGPCLIWILKGGTTHA